MKIKYVDFNNAGALINGALAHEWRGLETALLQMPLHLKASDQAGIHGNAIFDVVGTNEYIANHLTSPPLNWQGGIPIQQNFSFLGKDVDFGKNGLIVEVQFSNSPFLINNTVRSELFYRSKTMFNGSATKLVIIVTKARMFPSSNSTLYYEQALQQLTALAQHSVFTVPIRLVGLFEAFGQVTATWTTYSAARYSRTVSGVRQPKNFTIIPSSRGLRCKII